MTPQDNLVAALDDLAGILAGLALREGWVTIDGAHVFIGDDGVITKGPAALIGKTHTAKSRVTPASKSDIAKLAHGGGSKHEQDLAEQTEHELSTGLGMPKSPDNKPFDLQTKTVGVEIKTLVSNTNDKITMSKSAMAHKNAEVAKSGLKKTFTVVADKRTSTTKYFIRAGYGSFRIGSMTEVADHAGLSAFMRKRS